MVGLIVRCRVPFNRDENDEKNRQKIRCHWVASTATEKVWLALEGGAYVSTGVNHGGINYEFPKIGMLAFEPMLEFRYDSDSDINEAYRKGSGKGAVYGGVGFTINRFLVSGAPKSFTKDGIKLRPIAIAFSGWAIEYNLRLYPDGFTPDEFKSPAPLNINRPFEAVQSISVSVPWKK